MRPKLADRERIEAALRARLGPEALPADSGMSQAVSATSWKVVTGVTAGVFAIGAAAFWTLSPIPRAPEVQARTAASNAETVPMENRVSNPLLDMPPIAAPVTEPVEPAPVVASKAPAAARDRLAREVALMSQATVALRAGRVATALRVLGEHQQKFPNGALSEERRAAKAQALCLLGRVSDGRAELARLTPRSPAAAHAERVCETAASAHASDQGTR